MKKLFVRMLTIMAVLLLVFAAACGEEDEGGVNLPTGTGKTYIYDAANPLFGVYSGDAPMFGGPPSLSYWEFTEDGICYAYAQKMNLIMVHPYNWYSDSNTIVLGEGSQFFTFGNNLVVNHGLLPASNMPPFTNVNANEAEITMYMGDENQVTLSRLSTAFPSSQQAASTKITLNISSATVANLSIMAFGFVDETSGGPNAGMGICTVDGGGSGSMVLYVPDSAFEGADQTNISFMAGDFNQAGYLEMAEIPFVTYAGFPNWDGMSEPNPVNVTKGVEATYTITTFLNKTNFK